MKNSNAGKTRTEVAKNNILQALCGDPNKPFRKAAIGYAEFPEYTFSSPQGAAFSVAKLVREMEDDGLVRHVQTVHSTGYMLTTAGRIAAAHLQAPKGRD